jgi:hypothetical protein
MIANALIAKESISIVEEGFDRVPNRQEINHHHF